MAAMVEEVELAVEVIVEIENAKHTDASLCVGTLIHSKHAEDDEQTLEASAEKRKHERERKKWWQTSMSRQYFTRITSSSIGRDGKF